MKAKVAALTTFGLLSFTACGGTPNERTSPVGDQLPPPPSAIPETRGVASTVPASTTPVKAEVDLSTVTLPPAGSIEVIDATHLGERWETAEVNEIRDLLPVEGSVRLRMKGMEDWPEECLVLVEAFTNTTPTPDRAPDFDTGPSRKALQEAANRDAVVQRQSELRAEMCGKLEVELRAEVFDPALERPVPQQVPPTTVVDIEPVFSRDQIVDVKD